jgi:uncharacterized membrane protein
MTALILAALTFLGLHSIVSATGLRAAIVRRIGEGPYRGLFSLATAATLVWLGRAYSRAFYAENVWLWQLPGAQHLAAPVMLVAFLFAVVGMTSRNPTSVGQEGSLARDPEARGIQRITRHPFLCGVVLWSALHAGINGDVASLVLFATFLVVAVIGMRSIDRKRARALGDAWIRYRASTSIVPFAAIAKGRNRFVLGEIGWWRPSLALILFAIAILLHGPLFHAYPLPGMG